MANEDLKNGIITSVKDLLDKQTKDVKGLLAEQTTVILSAVDERLINLEIKIGTLNYETPRRYFIQIWR